MDSDICFGNPPLHWLEETSKLIWLQLNTTGFDQYLSLKDYKFQFTELARLQTLKQCIGVPIRENLYLLSKKKVLVLGSGAIAQKIKLMLSGFECETTLLDSKTISQITDYLTDTDILISTLPETTETKGLISEEYLSMLNSTALFVNVGRGFVFIISIKFKSFVNKLGVGG